MLEFSVILMVDFLIFINYAHFKVKLSCEILRTHLGFFLP